MNEASCYIRASNPIPVLLPRSWGSRSYEMGKVEHGALRGRWGSGTEKPVRMAEMRAVCTGGRRQRPTLWPHSSRRQGTALTPASDFHRNDVYAVILLVAHRRRVMPQQAERHLALIGNGG